MRMRSLSCVLLLLLRLSSMAAADDDDDQISAEVNPLHYRCRVGGGRYAVDSAYLSNLKALAEELVTKANTSNFASGSASSAAANDTVYGFVLCRGDYSGARCIESLRKAFENAVNKGFVCPSYKDVTIYYDQHMLRFSGDSNVLQNRTNNRPAWVAWNMNNETGAAGKSYGAKVHKLINATVDAVAASSSGRYATGMAGFVEDPSRSNITVYGLVQCTPDLSASDCWSCLADLARRMPEWFSNEAGDYRYGGRILGPRFNLRYEQDLFFQETNNETLKIDMPKPPAGKILSRVDTFAGFVAFIVYLIVIRGIVQRIKDVKLHREQGDWHNEVTEKTDPMFSLYHFPMTTSTKSNFSEGHGSFGLLYRLLLVILTAALLLQSTAGAVGCYNHEKMTTRVKPLYYDCGCFSPTNNSYYDNRMNLTGMLVSNISASPDNFFASCTVGSLFGFVLCRRDYNGSDCALRVIQTIKDYITVTNNNTNQIICPSSMDITIYYDQHLLSISGNEYVYKDPDSNTPAWVASNMNYVKNDSAGYYGERVHELLNATAVYAASNSSDLYATGISWFEQAGVSKIYGLVQCRPDMKTDLCRQCLDDLILKIPEKFIIRPAGDHCFGGRILGIWCNLRFETEPFFELTQETIKLHEPKSRLSNVNIALITIAGFVVFVLCLNLIRGIIQKIRDRKLQRELGEWHNEVTREIDSRFSLYHFPMIRDATGNFSEENKLGHGSFGFVYRGILPDGLEIAVKRLDASSWQGSSEFLNEIKLIVKLQHANLVRLLGCCLQRSEMILVYEYMPHRSLDYVFSDPVSRDSLNWSNRLRVIDGIAQGLVYLHNFSEPQKFIIHRDMKLSNILLDSEMNPKISDFGIARIYDLGAIEPDEPTDVVGTCGYMAPEYIRERMLSVKYDVFSFGVLLLEILSGRRVNAAVFTEYGRSDHLLTHAWHIWRDERYNQLVDPSLRGVYQMLELRRRIQIALLCVQENPDHRPHMRDVTTMLSNNDVSLPVPHPPAYFNMQLGDAEASASNNGTVFYTSQA